MSNNAFFSDLLASISERGRTLLRRAGSSDTKQDASDLLQLCEALLSGRGEASGTAMAREVLDRYRNLDTAGRLTFFEALARNYGPDREKLAQAIEALRAPGDRMVLGPASDGGYYLIGLKHPYQQLFTRIAWGTETVARTTCERAAEIGLATTLLPEWYDVDDLKTLRWLQDELFGHATRFRGGGFAAASRAFLKDAPQINP